MNGLGIEAEPNPMAAARGLQLVEQLLGHDAFAVIANDDGGHGSEAADDLRGELSAFPIAQTVAALAVDAHDLLRVGDHTRFHARGASIDGSKAAALDALCLEELFQLLPAGILSDGSKKVGANTEGGQVSGDVACAPGHEALTQEFQYRDRASCECGDAGPDKMIEHDVTTTSTGWL